MNESNLGELPKIALYAARILGFNTTKANSGIDSAQHQQEIVPSLTDVKTERYYNLKMSSIGITYNR